MTFLYGRAGSATYRAFLLAGTILGSAAAGAPAQAANETVTISAPQGGVRKQVNGTDTISITSTASGVITDSAASGVSAATADGDATIHLGASVTGLPNGVNVTTTGAGSSTITTDAGASVTGTGGAGIYVRTANATLNLRGTISGSNTGVDSGVTTGNLTITTSAGAKINGGAGVGIVAGATDGATIITLGDNVRGSAGVTANTSGTGTIKLTTAQNVTLTGTNGTGASVAGSNVQLDLGGAVSGTTMGLLIISKNGPLNITTAAGATVTGTTGGGISANAMNGDATLALGDDVTGNTFGVKVTTTGLLTLTTAAGASLTGGTGAGLEALSTAGAISIDVKDNVSGAIGIKTETQTNGATNIAIGAASTVTGSTAAISAKALNGAVTINNAGTIKGSVAGVLANGGAASFTLNNTGTVALTSTQNITGFQLVNQSGGVLAGTGNFGSVSAKSGSTIRPGDRSVASGWGVLSATSLTLASGAIVDMRADYSGSSDKIAVSGAAALNGATLKITATPKIDATWLSDKSFTILTAGNVTGTFASTQLDYAFLKADLAYTSTDVTLKLSRNWVSFGLYALTPNQKAVAKDLDRFQTLGSNPLIAKVTTLTIPQAPAALDQLSGAGLVAARRQAFDAAGLLQDAVSAEMDPFTRAGDETWADSVVPRTKRPGDAPPSPIVDGRVWARSLGSYGNLRADGLNPSERSAHYALAAGADAAVAPGLRAGFALSGGQTTAKVPSLATKAEAVWGEGALYGLAVDGPGYAKAALVYGYMTTDTARSVTAFAAPEAPKGRFASNFFSGRLEVGQKVFEGFANVTPYAAFEPAWVVQGAYVETNAPTVALGFGKTVTRALPWTLGVKLDNEFVLQGMTATPSTTLGWVHHFADPTYLSPYFASLPGSGFTVTGPKTERNLARADFNIEAAPQGSAAAFYANARAEIGQRASNLRGTAGMTMRF